MKKIKIALTGRLRVGKDYCANQCSGTIISVADPIYRICEALTGYSPQYKDVVPFVRRFYQIIGQWGRGEVNEQYPLDINRSMFTALVKVGALSAICPDVDFSQWGTNKIWLDAMLRRADSLDATRIFCSNVRFKDEFDTLKEAGWDHWHVLCSRQTYEERLREVNMTVNDPRLSDVSEHLAATLDNVVINIIKTEPTGPKRKVIWNDHRTSPSDRLFSVEEFKQYVENNECEPSYTYQSEPETQAPADSPVSPGNVSEPTATAGTEPSKDRDPAERRRKRTAKPRHR